MSHLFWLLENGKVFFLFISKCCKQIQIAMWNHEGGKIRNENWKINMIVILPPPYILPYVGFPKILSHHTSYIHTSSSWYLPLATFNQPLLGINHDLYNGLFYPPTKSSDSIESLTQFIGILVRSSCSAEIRRSETAEKQGQE